jgi:hypothetical protein
LSDSKKDCQFLTQRTEHPKYRLSSCRLIPAMSPHIPRRMPLSPSMVEAVQK